MADIFNTNEGEAVVGEKPSRKFLYIGIGVLVFLLLAGITFYLVVVKGGGNPIQTLKNLSPFGQETPDVTTGTGTSTNDRLGDLDITHKDVIPRFFKIADGPVSGYIEKTLPGNARVVRYVVRADGDIYEYDLAAGISRILVNNSIPKVYEAVWEADGRSVLFRTLDDQDHIITVLGKIVPNTATTTGDEAPAKMNQEFLPNNIAFISPGRVGGFVYTVPLGNSMLVNTLNTEGEVSTIFSSPYSEWLPEWPTPTQVTLATKPAAGVDGYLFTINADTSVVTQTVSAVPGLTARMSPDGKKVLISESKKGEVVLSVLDPVTQQKDLISPSTLPEKCTWSASSTATYCGTPENLKAGSYPDEWYQGLISFSDAIWKFDLTAHSHLPVAVPRVEAGVQIDAINLATSADERYLFMINKADGSLWGVDLSIPPPANLPN